MRKGCLLIICAICLMATGLWAGVKTELDGVIYGNELVFNQPQFAFWDSGRQRLYIVDSLNNRLVSFNSQYKYISEFTAGGKLNLPIAMVRDDKGRIVVSCAGDHKVYVIYLKEKKILPLDFSAYHQRVIPYRLAFYDGYLYVVDKGKKCIFIFEPKAGGYSLKKWIKEKAAGIDDIKVRNGHLYVLDSLLKRVFIYSPMGNFERVIKLKGVVSPVSLDVDERGTLYVLDKVKGKIILFNPNGEMVGKFGKLGWKEGRFYYPQYLLLSGTGKIFVVDTGNGRVQVFDLH